MSPYGEAADTRPAVLLVAAQAITTVVVGAAGFYWSRTVAESAALGGLIGLMGTLYFARQAFRYPGGVDPAQAAKGFYKGLAGKIVVVAVGFVVVLRWYHPVSPGALFAGFAIVQFMTWLAPFWIDRR